MDTNNTYIQIVAADLLRRFGTDLSRVAVVFPNKRASLFLNKELARQAGQPVWSPEYITISDLFRRHSDLVVADQIELVCRLYDVFVQNTGHTAETLDRFYAWGQLLLSDFDDLDKNLGDSTRIFQLIQDTHELDSTDYLTDDQREALKEFFATFDDRQESRLQEKFLTLWSRLGSIYADFRELLRDNGICYEGMLYRDVVEQAQLELTHEAYCFVGFNMLHEVERKLFHMVKDEDKALFYWDYDAYYMQQSHEAGHFIEQYLREFPDALGNSCKRDNMLAKDYITIAAAPTETLQARYVSDWLREKHITDLTRAAVVMCNEQLLTTIIHSLPPEVQKVNITTGYPVAQTPVVALLSQLIDMQTAGLVSGSEKYRLQYVNPVLRHPYSKFISPLAAPLYSDLNTRKVYFPKRADLITGSQPSGDGGLQLLFCDINAIELPDRDALSYNTKLIIWLQRVLKHIAQSNSELTEFDQEVLFRIYQVLQRLLDLLLSGLLDVDTTTLRRLLGQIVSTTTVPFHGEPVEGLQIMGVLETRCLDFDHLLILSCNEGNMPKGVNDASFIPHAIRKAYGLTTVEHKVGIYSYYFHRLLQRCPDVTVTYCSSVVGTNASEMSRFLLQMMVESGLPCRKLSLQVGQQAPAIMPKPIEKTPAVREKMLAMLDDNRMVSPSSLGVYLRCQLKYYYQYVERLREQDEDNIDEMDNRVFGLVFHATAELLYKDIADADGTVRAETMTLLMKDDSRIGRYVDEALQRELFHITDKGDTSFRREYTGQVLINRKVIIQLVKSMLQYDMQYAPFTILLTEETVTSRLKTTLYGKEYWVTLGGYIDRLDVCHAPEGDVIRVVDYKTGRTMPKDMQDVGTIFMPESIAHHSDYYLQSMLYSLIVRHSKKLNSNLLPVQPNLLYVQKCMGKDYSSALTIGKEPISDIATYEQEFAQGLRQLLEEIHNPDVPFVPTDKKDTCEKCPYAAICGA